MFETYFVRKSSGAKILIFSHSPKKVRKSAAKVTKKYLQIKYLYFFYCDTFFLQYILHKRTTLFCGILNIYYFCTQHHALFLESADFFVINCILFYRIGRMTQMPCWRRWVAIYLLMGRLSRTTFLKIFEALRRCRYPSLPHSAMPMCEVSRP